MHGRRYGMMLVGLAALASVAVGVLMGEQASAEMAPFYANLAVTAPADSASNGVEIVSSDGSRAWIETADLSYKHATTADVQDASY